MNNKGFAISSMVFGLVIIASLVLFLTLSISNNSKKQSNDFVDSVEEKLHSPILSQAYVDGKWQNSVASSGIIGTTGLNKRMKAFKIIKNNINYEGDISYYLHISDVGWSSETSAPNYAGDKDHQIEAIIIRLKGSSRNSYDLWYRVNVQEIGWMNWAKAYKNDDNDPFLTPPPTIKTELVNNGIADGKSFVAGTVGYACGIEAIQLYFLKSSQSPPYFGTSERSQGKAALINTGAVNHSYC